MMAPQKRILFIVPSSHSGITAIAKNLARYKEIPYGVLSIIAYVHKLARRPVAFHVLDLNLHDGDLGQRVQDAIDAFSPDIIGISGLFTSMFNQVRDIAAIIKSHRPKALLIAGGNVATNCANELFKYNPYLDAACYSEGEIPMLDLVNADDPSKLLAAHPSWMTRAKIDQGLPARASYVQNLDDIPPLDFSLIELSRYDSRCRTNNPTRNAEREGTRLPFITSRGCPFKCVFCAAGSLAGTKVRYMSPERVVADMRLAKERFGMSKIVINDDQALLRKDKAKRILSGIAELGLTLEYPSGLNVKFIDEELARLFKAAGLDVANLAIESGSERVLTDIIDKPLKIKDIRPVVEMLRKQGLLIHGFFIFGFLGETREDREATIALIKDVGFDWASIYAAAPIRGSRLYQICVDKGYITDDSDLLSTNIYESHIRTSDEDPEYITRFVYQVNLDVNFISNYRLRIGDYDTAIAYFDNVVKNHPGHAFAHRQLAKAFEAKGANAERRDQHRRRFEEIVASDPEWAAHSRDFQLI